MTQTPLFGACPTCGHDPDAVLNKPKARRSDPATSKTADDIARSRRGSQLRKLLIAHAWNVGSPRYLYGLTDEEAASHAGVSLQSEYATRCSELRAAGMLEDTMFTRRSWSGAERMIRRITPLGLEIWKRWEAENG